MIRTFSSTIRRREMDAVLTCMVDEKIGPGDMNRRLVQAVKESLGCDGALALRTPDFALSLALKALGVPAQSEIILSALAPRWHYSAVQAAGYVPVVLDVSEENALIAPGAVEAAVQGGARAIVLHETLGILPDSAVLQDLDVPVIEDISHSYGAAYSAAADGAGRPFFAGMAGSYAVMGLEERDIVTGGGGALLIAPKRREWSALKPFADELSSTQILPDINCALAYIQMREFSRNEAVRKVFFAAYHQASLAGRHRTFAREADGAFTAYSFPLVLSGGFKDAKRFAERKDIEIRLAFEDSIVALRNEELASRCITANSLYLRTVLFPLYPFLKQKQAETIAKTIGMLP